MDDLEPRALAAEYGPYAVLAGIVVFMAWIRARAEVVNRVITPDAVLFSSGNDPWYHARIVHLTVRHFPSTQPFDPWSYFPYGTARHSGFGGLFDQLIALAALIVGIGDPSPRLIDIVVAFAPVFFGTATVVPVYLIAARLTDRWSGLIVAVLLALVGGQFLNRTILGNADHQSAEAFFGAIAVLGVVYAVETAYRERPTTADIQDRNWLALRRPTIAGLLGGVAVASYLMMWAPGVMLVFVFGVFALLQLVRDHLRGRSLEYLTFGVGLSMLTTAVLTLVYAKSYTLSSTSFSLLQPLLALGIAVGAVVLFGLSEYLGREGYDPRTFPAATVVVIAGALVATAAVYPRSIHLVRNLVVRIYSFGILTSPSALTVAEIAPATLSDAWGAFGALFYLAVVGLLVLVARVVREDRPMELLVVLWSLTIFSAYFTMIRFGYYMAVNVALLSGFALWWVGRYFLRLDTTVADPSDLEAYQILGVIIILIAVIPGNVVAVQDRQPVWETSTRFGGADTDWHGELAWMRNSTPAIPLDYTARYSEPTDGDFDYPQGAYGVMSWWDYGHWITVTAHRIPNANPFQEGPRAASAYFQAQAEERAELILEALPSLQRQGGRIPNLTNRDLRSIVDAQTDQQAGEDTRYVVIDDQMAGGKFGPIATWTGPGRTAYFTRERYRLPQTGAQLGGNVSLPATNDLYRGTMLSKLYFADASGLEHYRLVHEADRFSAVVGAVNQDGRIFARTAFVLNGGWSQVRSVAAQIQQANRAKQAISAGGGWYVYDGEVESRVKVYERVPGATLSGTANASNGTTVFAFVQLQTNTGRNFTYIQQTTTDANGDFAMTVPYATTDGVTAAEGGTNAGVTATGTYSVFVGNPFAATAQGSVEVPEPAIYAGRTITVELEPVERPSGNETAETGTGGNATSTRLPTAG